jgi:hypothetical protein
VPNRDITVKFAIFFQSRCIPFICRVCRPLGISVGPPHLRVIFGMDRKLSPGWLFTSSWIHCFRIHILISRSGYFRPAWAVGRAAIALKLEIWDLKMQDQPAC